MIHIFRKIKDMVDNFRRELKCKKIKIVNRNYRADKVTKIQNTRNKLNNRLDTVEGRINK